jgi:hypothetical protein
VNRLAAVSEIAKRYGKREWKVGEPFRGSAGIRDEKKGPLFRTLTTAPGRPLSLEAMPRPDPWP